MPLHAPARARSAYDAGLSHFDDGGDGLGMDLSAIGGVIGTAVAGPGVGTAGGAGVGTLVANLFGGTGKYGTVQSEGAEQARVDMALLGAQHGSVQAAQFLLGQSLSDTSNYAKQATQKALATLSVSNPDVYAQAEAAGPQYDTADGIGVMQILLNLGIPYNGAAAQYAGYNTTTTQAGSAQAMALAQQVKRASPLLSLPGGVSLPATVGIPGTQIRVSPLLLVAGAVGAYVLLPKLVQRR